MNFINPYGICAFMFNLLLLVAYFSKKRIHTIENRIYDIMVLTSFFGTVIGLLTSLVASFYDKANDLLLFVPKLYLVYLVVWGTTFCLYVIAVSILKGETNRYWKMIKLIIVAISTIVGFFSLILPMDFITKNNITYTSGLGVNLVYYLAFAYSIVMFIFILKNLKDIKNKKYLPVLSFLVLGVIIITIQFKYPHLLLMTLLVTFNTMLMYFTVENPDVKVIEEINYLKMKAESDVKAKNKFLKNMSHEISTPINKAKGINSFNIDGVNSLDEAKDNAIMVDQILDELTEKSKSIINNIKLESGSVKINNESYKPSDLFDSLKKLVITNLKFKEKELTYKEKISSNIPDMLYGDKEKIKEITMQLLNNSIKYSKKGTITLIVTAQIKKNKCILNIKVKDSGIGIDKTKHKDLFKAFSRIDVENNITISGLGLGLSNAKLMIESLNGKIELLESEVGKGSIFAITVEPEIIQQNDNQFEV